MTDTGIALLRAILDDHASDDRRLIYADWLDDQGEAERAEFVRVQIELARLSGPKCGGYYCDESTGHIDCADPFGVRATELRRRERELLMSLRPDGWNCKLPYYPRTDHCNPARATMQCEAVWRRGFIDEVCCRLADWVGTECGQCSGHGTFIDYPEGEQPICHVCRGTGRLNANGPQIVACQPVTLVVVTHGHDTDDATFRMLRSYYKRLLPFGMYTVPHDWQIDVGTALVRWARNAAGLHEPQTTRTTP